MPTVRLPNGWHPRGYQRDLWDYFERGGKRGVAVWHRRAGKDDVALHLTAVKAHERVGNYWHMLPEADQARKAIWTAINPHSKKLRIDEAFPEEVRESTDNGRMLIKFKCGSTWQVVGSDNYNSLVGAAPVGLVFSEWALADPNAWAYLRPILAENGGWALFIYTPRGRNHGSDFFYAAEKDPAHWFSQKLSARQTTVFRPEQLQSELAEYIVQYGEDDGESRFRQEYLCDFDAAVVGSYFGRAINRLEEQGRLTSVPHDPRYPVYTGWDLGKRDATVIWFVQLVGREVRVFDYLENSGKEIDWYARELKAKPYTYEEHILPHDAEAEEMMASGTRVGMLKGLLPGEYQVLPRAPVDEGIHAARVLLPRCVFDARVCEKGLTCLRNYKKEWDDRRKVFHDKPLHDWASHAADAFRYLALGLPVTERRLNAPANLPQRAPLLQWRAGR